MERHRRFAARQIELPLATAAEKEQPDVVTYRKMLIEERGR